MKRRYALLTAVMLIIVVDTVAAARELSVGTKAGLTISNITQTPKEWEDKTSYKAGFAGGVFLNYAFNGNFSLQPELLYSQKRFKSNLYDGIILVDLTVKLDYFELPVLAKYTFSGKGNFKPCVFAGPFVAYSLSSNLEVSALIFSADVDFSSLTHTTDFGLVVGTGFDFELANRRLVLDLRYQLGLTNVILSGDFEINGSRQTISEDDFKNYGFVFMLGYVF